MIERSPREHLEELKWLRGGVLAVHAMLNAIDQFDDDARARFDWSALAYLTEQMQQVVLEGAVPSQLKELEEAPSKTVTELMNELRASLDRASGASPEKPRKIPVANRCRWSSRCANRGRSGERTGGGRWQPRLRDIAKKPLSDYTDADAAVFHSLSVEEALNQGRRALALVVVLNAGLEPKRMTSECLTDCRKMRRRPYPNSARTHGSRLQR